MNKSDSIAKLAMAMTKAQSMVGIAIKNAVNPHLKNRYADLGAVWDAVMPALQANELSVLQLPAPSEDGRLHLETLLMHSSGEWLSSTLVMPLAKADPQGYGGALTYARRYALAALMGVTQDDDDGERATSWREKSAQQPASETQIVRMQDLLKDYGRSWEQLSAIYPSDKRYKDADIAIVTAEDMAKMIKFVEGKLKDAHQSAA